MTIETTYGTICTLLRAYDTDAGRACAESVIADPARYLDHENPVYSSAAALLTDIRAKLDSRTTPKTVTAAIKRMIANVDPARPQMQGVFPYGGQFVVCDSYRLIRLDEDISSLPHVENDFDVASVMRGIGASGETLTLPNIPDLKAFLAAEKARKKQEGRRYQEPRYCLNGWMYVNPQYLLDMMQALPGCTAYRPKAQVSPIYFQAGNGDGILLPTRPPQDAAKTA